MSGMPTGSHKKRGTTFCGKLGGELPLPVRSFKDPPPPYTVRNYRLGFRRISGVNILVQKKRISTVRQEIGIPVMYRDNITSEHIKHLNFLSAQIIIKEKRLLGTTCMITSQTLAWKRLMLKNRVFSLNKMGYCSVPWHAQIICACEAWDDVPSLRMPSCHQISFHVIVGCQSL